MMLDKDSLFWTDSELKKIEIVYDKIVISVFNDVLKKMVYICCCGCVGITEFITWDEVVIDNIYINTADNYNDSILLKAKSVYGNIEHYGKPIGYKLTKVKVVLLDEVSFSVICEDVSLYDNYPVSGNNTGDGTMC